MKDIIIKKSQRVVDAYDVYYKDSYIGYVGRSINEPHLWVTSKSIVPYKSRKLAIEDLAALGEQL